MVNIIRNEGSTIFYSCDCGTNGRCMIRPFDEGKAIVVDIECPNCLQTERILLLQYSSEESKEEILQNMDEMDLTWSFIVENEKV